MSSPTGPDPNYPPPGGAPQGQPGWNAPPQGYGQQGPGQQGYSPAPSYAGGPAPTGQRPGMVTAAGIIGIVWGALGLLALAWTIVMIMGSIRALSGRSRVLLIVGGSIAVFFTGLSFFGSLGDDGTTAGGVIFSLVLFGSAIAIVVLLSMKPAAQFFAAHRARRGIH